MPRAGWCRECGEWIWVDEEGACQHGHDADCVTGIHEASPMSRDRGLGEGDLPAELKRFNWGAFLLTFFWALAYGAWPVMTLWLIGTMTPLVLLIFVGAGGESAIAASGVGITVISEIVSGIIRIYIGANANRMLWNRERLRLEVVEGARPRISVPAFLKRQRVWVWVGAVLMAVSALSVAVIGFLGGADGAALREQVGVSQLDAQFSLVWIAAEIVLGLWLAAKMRQESLGQPEDPARDPV